MKKYILMLLLFVMFGCNSNENRIVDTDPVNYVSLFEAKPDNFDELNTLLNKDIQADVMSFKRESGNENDDIQGKFHGRALVNKSGKLERIFILSSLRKDIDDYIVKKIESFDFQQAKIDDKPVSYKFDFYYKDSDYFLAAEVMPEPVGGIAAIAENVHYPEIAKRAGIEGRVFVKAIIDEDGNVIETEVIKGLGAGTDEAAIEAIKKTKFKPGMINNKPVKVQIAIPIQFKLQ